MGGKDGAVRVAITGGSGFLGRALIERLTADGADRIVTLTRDEQRRAQLQAEWGWHPGFRVYAGDVREGGSRLADIFHGCEAVIHGAARKVVSGHPDEPDEMLATNIEGTKNVVEAARDAGCQKLVFVSSDKAVYPINTYGKSKAFAEELVTAANARTLRSGLRCGAVRYGNVLGSTGSVIVKWRAQLAAGKPLTVSHGAMTRFWITRGQAVDLVLAALANLRGGEIVVPYLPAASIETLARAVGGDAVRLAPVDDVPTEPNGIRQGGEKIHEELLNDAEVRRAHRINGDGRIVIPPFQHAEMWDDRPWMGTPLPPETVYRSDVWQWQLSVAEMRGLLESGCPA